MKTVKTLFLNLLFYTSFIVSSNFEDQHNQHRNETFQKWYTDRNSSKKQLPVFTEEEKNNLKLFIITNSQYNQTQKTSLFKAINNGIQAYQTELNKINKGIIAPLNTPR